MNENAGPAWHVVHTHVHAEMKAAAHLARQGYEIYLPRCLKRRRHARRLETVAIQRHCFRALLLCRLRPPDAALALDLFDRRGRAPCLQRRRAGRGAGARRRGDPAARGRAWVRASRSGPRFAPGDQVRIVGGIFTDCVGLFQDMTDRERVTVLLEFLGRKVKVTLDGAALDAA